ncbi:NACHT domain-containing protein [Catenulispora pinisilvae]|uniref:NACHT domain-containing protein n=1 Tax=Catenulispora pinisilvae TaxID=2705253 RepID=UPI00189277EC|nr:NACHT domain-containing protein [Catenulispora pinisilvae]
MAEPNVRNEAGGTSYGPLVQAGKIESIVFQGSFSAGRIGELIEELAQAVDRRWHDEENLRRIQDPVPLPVRYGTAAEDLIDHWETIRRLPAGEHAAPLDLSGTLDQLAGVYERVPSRRLVVLGRAGSGKTILALRFVLDRLARRAPGTPVPVLFSLGSWDPSDVPLKSWLISRLIRDHPGLAAADRDGRTLAAVLVDAQLILPVLDGFDELADGLHRIALRKLSADPLMPMMLTSRIEEYRDAVVGTRGLSGAAAVEVRDLTLDDLDGYLPRTSAKETSDSRSGSDAAVGTTKWQHVLATLRDSGVNSANGNNGINGNNSANQAGANLAAVLTTPLMVALARAVYSEDHDKFPTDLMDPLKFASVAALEEHFLGGFLRTVYEQPADGRRPGSAGRWTAQQAEGWLRFIAEHLRRLETGDLAWWQLAATMRRRSRALLIAGLGGLIFGLVTGIGNIPIDLVATDHGLGFALKRGLAVGLLHGLAAGLMFGTAHFVADRRTALKPLPVRLRRFGGPRWFREKMAARLGWGIGFGASAALGIVLVDQVLLPDLHLDDGMDGSLSASLLIFPTEIGLGAGLAFALVAVLEAPIDIKAAGSPSDLLRASRKNVAVHLLVWALVIGPEAGIVAGFLTGPVRAVEIGVVFGIESALGAGVGYGLSLTAWGQWVAVARIWLPLNGALPWRLVAFLDDGCRRGVLRQSGAVYQFRHARLREHLIQHAPSDGGDQGTRRGWPQSDRPSSAIVT